MWIAVAKVSDVRADDVMEVTANGVAMVVGREGQTYFAMQRVTGTEQPTFWMQS